MRLLLVCVLLLQGGPFRVYLPFAANTVQPVKGVAGYVSMVELWQLGATWNHHWSLCKENELRCVDVSKGSMAWEYDPPEEIAEALATCDWFMFGDEWELQDMPMEQQVAELKWFLDLRKKVNPNVKVAFGGVMTFHPRKGLIAPEWVPAFYQAYVDAYGEAPDVQAIVFDDYWWPAFYYNVYSHEGWEAATRMSVDAVRDTYGPVEIWAREIGSLWSQQTALESIEQMGDITKYYDRYAFFISRGWNSGWGYTSLFGRDGNLTGVGEAYRRLGEIR